MDKRPPNSDKSCLGGVCFVIWVLRQMKMSACAPSSNNREKDLKPRLGTISDKSGGYSVVGEGIRRNRQSLIAQLAV